MSRSIGIVGAGAIGGWVAARLALAGNQVSVLARGATADALADGITIVERGAEQVARPIIATDPASLGAQDLVIIAVKAPALAEAAQTAQAMIGPDTLIVPMMNGVPWWFVDGAPLASVDPGARIAAALPIEQVLGCVVHAACRRTAPARIEVAMLDKYLVGEPGGGMSDRATAVATLLAGAGLAGEAIPDIRRAIWYKLWGNMTANPISALTLATADRILANADTRAFMLRCMAEAAAIGTAIDCPITESGEDRLKVTATLGAFKTSMLQDVEAGRPIELDALLAAPLEIAGRVGVPAPNLAALHGLARLMGESRGLL
ncbi:MAG: 2-dehydropantoate 2-reductase [Sphingomonas bacterium]|nr:2-dehydropantoate 2-reductase [Sphingomonas bacterium]